MRLSALALVLVSACSELGLPPPPTRPRTNVSVEPVGELDSAPAVLRLRVAGALGRSALADFRLFQGTLSSYYLHRIAARDIPSTLLEREIAVIVWPDASDVLVAPTQALGSGVLSLATPELGLVAEVSVDATLVPWLSRRWPPRAETLGSGLAVFCGSEVGAASEGTVVLDPSGSEADIRLGLDDTGLFGESCLRVEPRGLGAPGAPSLPPALTGGVGLEPLPLVTGTVAPSDALCADDELAVGPACVTVDDDRLRLRSPGAPSLWALSEPERTLAAVEPGASVVLRGLAPATPVHLVATVFDAAGERVAVDTRFTTQAAHAHVVLNEVLANPAGPEASGEWVELVNDGAESVELDGFALRDSGDPVLLPAASLAPGEFTLLASERFDPDPALDVLPVPGMRVLRLQTLGQAGLANAGELLRLLDATGHVVSAFPAIPATTAGTSIARRTPDAVDDDARSFGEHAAPGASPGAPNELAE